MIHMEISQFSKRSVGKTVCKEFSNDNCFFIGSLFVTGVTGVQICIHFYFIETVENHLWLIIFSPNKKIIA